MEVMGNLRHLGLIPAHHSVIDPMTSFEKFMRLQPWLKPGHTPQWDNPDHSRDNPHRVGPGNLIYLYEHLAVGRWFCVAALPSFPTGQGAWVFSLWFPAVLWKLKSSSGPGTKDTLRDLPRGSSGSDVSSQKVREDIGAMRLYPNFLRCYLKSPQNADPSRHKIRVIWDISIFRYQNKKRSNKRGDNSIDYYLLL